MRRTALALAAAGGFLAWSAPAAARSARLAWRGPTNCASSDELHAAVERLLGEPITDGDAFRADAQVDPDVDGSFTLTLTIRTPEGTGTRTVRAPRCESLLNVAAFSIALSLNPELQAIAPTGALGAEPAAPPAPPPLAFEAATQPPVAVAAPTAATRAPGTQGAPRGSPANPELWFSAQALLDTSLLPSVAPGFQALGEVLLRQTIRLGLGGAAFVSQTKESAEGGGHFSLWSLEAHGCGQARAGVVLGLCPEFHLARVRGEGRGVTPRLEQRTWVPAPGVGVLASYEFSARVAATLRATALFPTNRNVFVIHAGPLHQIPAFSAEFGLGLELRAF